MHSARMVSTPHDSFRVFGFFINQKILLSCFCDINDEDCQSVLTCDGRSEYSILVPFSC